MSKKLRFALFGHPVAHSISPDLYRAAFAELGLPHRYEALCLPSEADFEAAMRALRAGEIEGANITLPYKQKALHAADRSVQSAGQIGAANVLAREKTGSLPDENTLITAHNTDMPALAEELLLLVGQAQFRPQKALVLGAGGAALAAIAALQSIGILCIGITTRSWQDPSAIQASSLADKLQSMGLQGFPYPVHKAYRNKFYQFAEQSDLIIQASSAGMSGGDSGEALSSLIPWNSLPARTLAYDLVYTPPETPFVRDAQKAGLRAAGGLGMLVRQAALSMQAWLLPKPDLQMLLHVANQAISRRFP